MSLTKEERKRAALTVTYPRAKPARAYWMELSVRCHEDRMGASRHSSTPHVISIAASHEPSGCVAIVVAITHSFL